MPPLKKFKPVESNAQASTPFSARRTHGISDGMHNTIMSGPTLSPEGQMPQRAYQNGTTTQAGQPPPGLRSPPGAPAYSNGYTSHHANQSGHRQAPSSSPTLVPNGTHQSNNQPPTTGRSASYLSPGTDQTPQQPKEHSPSQNPYLNSFDRQRPSSSHLTHNLPSPIKNRPSLSPPQTKALPVFPPTPSTNGAGTSQVRRSLSPVKQQSSPLMPPLQLPSSSPINHPSLQNNARSSPGLSPTKQSPPRTKSHDIIGTPVLPPVPSLEPSGEQQGFRAPTKTATPERLEGPNEVGEF